MARFQMAEQEDAQQGSNNSQQRCRNEGLSREEIQAFALRLLGQPPLPPVATSSSHEDAWGLLSAVSEKTRRRPQGPHILLHSDEHILGRLVKEPSFQFDSPSVSARHCRIFRKRGRSNVALEQDQSDLWFVSVKDTSSNGTYINWQKLGKDSQEVELKHGDIISLVNVPENENAFAFVFREITASIHVGTIPPQLEGKSPLKRKSGEEGSSRDDILGEFKRTKKRLEISGAQGSLSMKDVGCLQRSNENVKEQKDPVLVSFLNQIKQLELNVAEKEREVEEFKNRVENQQIAIEDLNQQLASMKQSRIDAVEVIERQKLTIAEVEEQLDKERAKWREEKKKDDEFFAAAMERACSEASEQLRQQSVAAARQLQEKIEILNKLQEADNHHRFQLEKLGKKMMDLRENLAKSENGINILETQLREEKTLLETRKQELAEKEAELHQAITEREEERKAKENALAHTSFLELELERTRMELVLEKRRLQVIRDRTLLRDSQLRAFHSTGEEIAALQLRQREQLKEMVRALEESEQLETMHDVSIDQVSDPLAKQIGDGLSNDAIFPSGGLDPEIEPDAEEENLMKTTSSSHGSLEKEVRECKDDARLPGAVGFGLEHSQLNETEYFTAARSLQAERDADDTQVSGASGGSSHLRLLENTLEIKDTGDTAIEVGGGETLPIHIGTDIGIDIGMQGAKEGREEGGVDVGATLPVPTGDDDDGYQARAWNEQTKVSKCGGEGHGGERCATINTADLLTSELAGSWAINSLSSVHGGNDCSQSLVRESEMAEEEEEEGGREETNEAEKICTDANLVVVGSQCSLSSREGHAWHGREWRKPSNPMWGIGEAEARARNRHQAADSEEETQDSRNQGDSETQNDVDFSKSL